MVKLNTETKERGFFMNHNFLFGSVGNTHNLNRTCGNLHEGNSFWVIIQHQTDFLYYRDGKMTEGYAGQLLIVPPHFKYAHTSRNDAKEGFIDDWMYFESETPLEKFEELDIPLGVAFDVVDKRLLKPYIEKLSFEKETQEIGYERQITALLEEMFIKIARQRTYCGESDNRKRLMFDKLRREMLSQYSSPHTLEELAAKVGYSRGHFAAIYRKYYGTSPIDDLINHRISIAKFELKRKGISITEIAQRCGFASIHHFSGFFKKHVGVSPLDYRNM